MNPEDRSRLELAAMLISRLERLSVDSYWAHHASGARRSLIRFLEERTDPLVPMSSAQVDQLNRLTRRGFEIIEKGARAMGDRK